MEGISDIRIIGIDSRRPPIVRKEPYIDLIFQLSHKAPIDWCSAFNGLLAKHPFTPKIKEKEGLYIETWVRSPDAIVEIVALLKKTVAECTRQYIEKIELSARNAGDMNTSLAGESGEQGRLNKIIAGLDFDEVATH